MDDVTSLLRANAAYYEAFQTRDFESMKQIWAADAISCIHPGWSPLAGRPQVIESYRRILVNSAQEPLTCSDETVIVSGDWARILCIENIGAGKLAVTNLFVRTGEGWRLVHHQAGPVAAEVPQQRRVLN
jgi:ketosteroid isomerase-like protein